MPTHALQYACAAFVVAIGTAPAGAQTAAPAQPDPPEIVVTASRLDLLGQAVTASQGSVTEKEVALRPIVRPGQLFESIPGLVVTIHSGEGKANQYLIRGYNLDHGTDFATYVDDMPVNRPTNAHGQGYTDLAFLMPQVVAGIDYTKGPYFADVGDFGSVASARTRLTDVLATQLTATVGSDGYQNLFAAGTRRFGGGQRLMGALELGHYDGPWHPAQDFRKVNALLRFSSGTRIDGLAVTGMYYKSAGRLITDQPLRAIETGLIDRFGTLNPSDASRSGRYSVSARLARAVGRGQLAVSGYAIGSTMTLWNDFTHYLDDPLNGDQQQQYERRRTIGGRALYTLASTFGTIANTLTVAVEARYDIVYVDRRHTVERRPIPYCFQEADDGPAILYPAANGLCNADRARLADFAAHVHATTRWTDWLRTTLGAREEFYIGRDRSLTNPLSGRGQQRLFQPKASLAIGPWRRTEIYASYGRGFHSNDLRGVFGTVPGKGIASSAPATPLLSPTTGVEIGLRTDMIPHVSLQLAAFQQDFGSELAYDADVGQDEAGASSRRRGLELSAQYRPARWLEVNGDLALSRPRYRAKQLADYGLTGPYIADAPTVIASAGMLVDGLGPWTGGVQWRRLGRHVLRDGERLPRSDGYSEVNLNVGYALGDAWKVQVSIFNLFDSRDNAADYDYTSRLRDEPDEGVEGFQVHPLERRSARLAITRLF